MGFLDNIKETGKALFQDVRDFVKPQESGKVRPIDVVREIPDTVFKPVNDIIQQAVQGVTSFGLKGVDLARQTKVEVDALFNDKEREQVQSKMFVPQSAVSRFVFGDEPVGAREKELDPILEGANVTKVGGLFVLGITADAFLAPGKKPGIKFIDNIASSEGRSTILKNLKPFVKGSKDELEELVNVLIQENKPANVIKLINESGLTKKKDAEVLLSSAQKALDDIAKANSKQIGANIPSDEIRVQKKNINTKAFETKIDVPEPKNLETVQASKLATNSLENTTSGQRQKSLDFFLKNPDEITKQGPVELRLVDDGLFIQDGRHRLEAARQLGLDVKTVDVTKEFLPKVDQIPVELRPLAKEAQKYNTAEEFIEAQPKVFHGTPVKLGKGGKEISIADKIKKEGVKESSSGNLGSGIYVARTEGDAVGFARRFQEGKAEIIENFISPTAKIYKTNSDILFNQLDELGQAIRQKKNNIKELAQKKGFDGIEIEGREMVIYNKNLIKTKSQLTDLFNKAKGVSTKTAKGLDSKSIARQGKRPASSRTSSRDSNEVLDISQGSDDSLPSSITQKKARVIKGDPEKKVKASQEDRDAINNILNQTELRPRPTTKLGEGTTDSLRKQTQDTIKKQNEKIPDEKIKELREQNLLGKETVDEIIARKRGIITDKEAIERAKVMQGTINDVLNIPKGAVPTKEQLTAVSQIVQQEREINKAIVQLIDNGGVGSSKAERELIKKLGRGFDGLDEHEILNRALEESTLKLRKAEIVLMGMKSEAGRTLQGAKQFVPAIDSRMRIVYGRINKKNALEQQAIIEKLGKVHLDNDREFIKFLDQLNTADFFDKFAEWSTAAKLWNPTTHAVNLGGNALRQLLDLGVTAITSPRTARADLMGARVGLAQGLKNSLKAMTDEGYAITLSKYIEEGGTAPAIGGKLGKWIRTPFRALGAGDEIFRAMGYQRSLYRQADRLAKGDKTKMKELVERPTFEMMDEATKQSKRMTFQEDMGELTQKINQFRTPANFNDWYAKFGSLMTRLFVPFLKTPTNLFKQAGDFSPLGLVKNADEIKKVFKAGDAEHGRRLLGEAILGSAIAAWVVQETLDGNITGGAPRKKGERDRFYRENKVPYAVKIGNKWYQYKRVDPLSTILATVSDITKIVNEEEGADAGGVIQALSNQLEDKTYLRGMSDLLKLVAGERWEREYVWKSMVLGASLPSFVGHTARSIDPTIRETDTILERIKSQTPFVSESLPVRVNVLGQPIERANQGFNYFFNPIQSEIAEIDPITRHLMEVDVTIPVPLDNFDRNKVNYKLTPAQYASYSRTVGKELAKGIEELMRDKKYQEMTDEEKKKEILDLRTDIQSAWKDEFVEKRTSKLEQIFGSKNKSRSLEDIFAK